MSDSREQRSGLVFGQGVSKAHVAGWVLVIVGLWTLADTVGSDVALGVLFVSAGVGVALRGELHR